MKYALEKIDILVEENKELVSCSKINNFDVIQRTFLHEIEVEQ